MLDYLRKYNVPYHPLHDVGFSSLGDVQVARPPPAPPRPAPPRRAPLPASLHPAPLPPAALTSRLPPPQAPKVPLEEWMTYAGERSGLRGMKAKDGSSKTECGIHSFDANAK